MLDEALRKEKESLFQQMTELQPKVDEFRALEARLQHVISLLEDGQLKNEYRENARINWAKLCRENGLQLGGDSGHRVLKRLKPYIHDAVSHDCEL